MPIVTVELWPGKTKEEKEMLMKGIFDSFEAIGMKKEWVTIMIKESPQEDWGIAGQPASMMKIK